MENSLQAITVSALFDLAHTRAAPLLGEVTFPWEALEGLADFICRLGASLGADYRSPAPEVWVHTTAKVTDSAFLGRRIVVGPGAEVRHGAFVRGDALIGEGVVIGNSTEVKNSILFDGVQVPHYNYVGDSVLGYKAHLGAGAVISNLKSDKTPVTVRLAGTALPTGRQKMGAMVGDLVEVGCNSVLNPGTVIGRGTRVYPLSMVRGYVPADSIYKQQGEVAQQE